MEAKGTGQLNAILHTEWDPRWTLREGHCWVHQQSWIQGGKAKSCISVKFSEVATVMWLHETISVLWKY